VDTPWNDRYESGFSTSWPHDPRTRVAGDPVDLLHAVPAGHRAGLCDTSVYGLVAERPVPEELMAAAGVCPDCRRLAG
jgi:hypothetical protein